jgi:transposase
MMERLPEDDIVHLMVDAVGLMEFSQFEATCKVGGVGQPPFAPAMLLTVLIYAYSHGVRSSRVIEQLCRRDAGYRFIVGNEVPDDTVIARFRQRPVGEIKDVFLQVLDLCREAGLIRLGLVALDGTKVKANAALDANCTASTIGEQVSRMLAEAAATDAQEDRRFGADAGGPGMPKGLGRHADRLVRLKACQEKLQARAAAAAARQQAKIAAREAEETASGKRKRGRKSKAPDPSVDPDTVANPTDPGSGIIKARHGWLQGYNAQAVVTPGQIILAADVTCEANDVHQLSGMLDQAQANVAAVMGEAALLGAAVADAGYWSAANTDSQTFCCRDRWIGRCGVG